MACPAPVRPESFQTDRDLSVAFGRAGYSLSIAAKISRPSTNPGAPITTTSVAVSGYVYDEYQWNSAVNQRPAAIQAGYNTLGNGGKVFRDKVQILAPPVNGSYNVPFTFH